MNRSELYKLCGVNLDLALEAHEVLKGEIGQQVPGVRITEEKFQNTNVSTVEVLDIIGESHMGKPPGTYITIEAPGIRHSNRQIHTEITKVLAKKISDIIELPEEASILIVGLGNYRATPDALGPKVVDSTLATRHLKDYAPEELHGGLRSVAAIAPGVLGTTGIETAEIILGIVEKIRPDLVIAIDALASRSMTRVGTTIQLADTGINPGSGVNNKRLGLTYESLGCPVLGIGVPTVISPAVVAHETMEQFFEELKTSPTLYQIYRGLRPETVQVIINRVLEPYGNDLMVTPKEIDTLIANVARIIAGGLAEALHPAIDPGEFAYYLH